MLILKQKVNVKWNQRNIKHFQSLGYQFTKLGDEFKVNVNDLMKGSKVKIEVLCDYCLEEGKETIIKKEYYKYLNSKNITIKDCCNKCKNKKAKDSFLKIYKVDNPAKNKDCINKMINTIKSKYGENYQKQDEYIGKTKETNNKKYGHDWSMQNDEIKEKSKNTMIYRYGVEHALQNESIMNKLKNTNNERYGYENAMQNENIKQKLLNNNLEKYGVTSTLHIIEKREDIINKIMQSLSNNGTCKSSKQQRYLHNLLGGELNYYFKSLLDIAFPDEMIYIEYDGSGHDLDIQIGKITKEEKSKKEIRRWYALFNRGWKEIRIISKNDYLPSDEIIIQLINEAKKYLNTNHSWVHINIDNSSIENSQYINKINLGELRKL